MIRVLIGMANENLVADLVSLMEEMEGYEVRAVASTAAELVDLAGRLEPQVVFVHDDLGIEPIAQIIRDLTTRRPSMAVLQVSQVRTSTTVIKAMEDGARGVVAYPFAYEDVSSRVMAAADWAQHMQAVLAGAAQATASKGEVVAIVGAKGGVGTTTMASHIAFDHVRNDPTAKVCLVDVDIEKGDVGAIFEVRQSVSIADVAKVSSDLSNHAVNDAVIHHESGIHLLLAPLDVRDAEYVTPSALRAIVSLLRRDFDLIVLDGGGHVSPAQAAVIEIASECIVVTTPDVLAIRAMRRRMIAWEALGVREEAAFKILINKVDRGSLFPPSAVERLTTGRVIDTQFPYSPRVLEAAVNDRDPRSVTEVAWWKLITAARGEVGLAAAPEVESPDQGRKRGRKPKRAQRPGKADPRMSRPHPTVPQEPEPAASERVSRREAGAIALETVGVFPAAVLAILIAWQVAVTGFSFIYAGHASTAAAREFSVSREQQDAVQAAKRVLPGTLQNGLKVVASGDTVSVTVPIAKGAPLFTWLPSTLTSTRSVVLEP